MKNCYQKLRARRLQTQKSGSCSPGSCGASVPATIEASEDRDLTRLISRGRGRSGTHLALLDLLPGSLGAHLQAAVLRALGAGLPHQGVLQSAGSEPKPPSLGPSSPLPSHPGAPRGALTSSESMAAAPTAKSGSAAGPRGSPGAPPRPQLPLARRFRFSFRSAARPRPGVWRTELRPAQAQPGPPPGGAQLNNRAFSPVPREDVVTELLSQ